EDGIRDYKVTGVQTCALPISQRIAVLDGQWLTVHRVGEQHLRVPGVGEAEASLEMDGAAALADRPAVGAAEDDLAPARLDAGPRSEERRVGKEGRSRWWGDEG